MVLDGIRILDLSRLLPGPLATAQLAALGADVVKVEDPAGGDYARWYPPVVGEPPVSGFFRELNRGKRSVTLDLRRPDDREAFRALVARADVLVDSFRPGVLDRLGLAPRALMDAHPGLIYCAITGFGLTGPDALRAGHDLGFVARAGVLALGGPAAEPVPAGVQVADVGAAMTAVSGILAALLERTRTGRGRVVDVSLLESALPFAAVSYGAHFAGKRVVRGEELLDGSRPAYGVYRTRDGRFLAVASLEPKFWSAFLDAIGRPDLADSALDGGAAGDAARAAIQARLAERDRDDWVRTFRELEACVEPVLELDEALLDPHLRARGAFLPGGGVAGPLRLRGWDDLAAAPAPQPPAPALGADTAAVLAEAGVAPELVARVLAGRAG